MNRKKFTILFYPQRPSKHSTIYKIVKMLNYEIVNNPSKPHDLTIAWEDITFRTSSLFNSINNSKIINGWCNDISKDKTDKEFRKIFDYSTFIDPITFTGMCVKKSNLNAAHDGKVIQCPIESPEDGFVYQKQVNNKNDLYGVYDIRTFIINGTIPFVLIKQKKESKRFRDYYTLSIMRETHSVFTQEETDKIIQFCRNMGMDYGELDILRDSIDNRIYIIDANNTPWWCDSLPEAESGPALTILAETFKKEFISNKNSL